MFTFTGGVSIRFAPLNGVISTTSSPNGTISYVSIDGNKNPFVNVNAGAGVGFLLRNKDIIKVGFNINYDPSYVVKGDFFLETNTSRDEGDYIVKSNTIGLMFIYSITKH